jgi:UDP-N-acetylmuramoyl-L-alanyl-D-glutamate--2,6-diaminopimelate ligase
MTSMIEKIKKIIPLQVFKFLQPSYHFLMGYLAALYYGFPSRRLIVVGITGTTGKTSTVNLLAKLLTDNDYQAGYTSTAQFNDGRREWLNDKKMTMPGRFFLQKTLSRMLKNGCKVAIVETTSQGIEQYRHRFIDYDILLFTNLYPEHIEAHGGFDNYKKAKGKLFSHLKRCVSKYINEKGEVVLKPRVLQKTELRKLKKSIIVNGDDEQALYFLSFFSEQKSIFSSQKKLDALNKEIEENDIKPQPSYLSYELLFTGADGSEFIFNNNRYHLSLLGDYNVINAVAALAVAYDLKIDDNNLAKSLENIKSLAGKMEKIEEGQNFTVLIDYAFEPKALSALYKNLKFLEHSRLIHVLGSTGGGRDQSRRPILGRLAAEQSDIVIVSNEDPYDEDPQVIIDQVALGAENAGKKLDLDLFKILDRREAISYALKMAKAGDLVLITGKGAEQYICGANGSKLAWDDREVAKEEIKKIL